MLSTYLASTVDAVLSTTLANYREQMIDKQNSIVDLKLGLINGGTH